MIRKLNRIFQDFMREKRLSIGKKIYDKKENKPYIKEGKFLEANDIKSILFLRYDGKIGDMVVNTLMFREIKKIYPNIKIGVVARGAAKEILKNNPNVDKVYTYVKNKSEIKNLAQNISKEKYDLLIDFSEMLRVNQMMFINICNAKFNMGLNKENWKMFDISYSYPDGNFHISDLYKKVLTILGIKNINTDYELYFSDEIKNKIENDIKKYENKKIYVINPFAASKHRDINTENIKKIIDVILKEKDRVVFVIGEKNRKDDILKVIKDYKENVFYPEYNSIRETAYLIKKCDFVVTPDTSIVHIAATFKKPMVAIYRLDMSEENNINKDLWAPNYKEATQIFSKDMDVKKGEEPDINKFDICEIDKVINKKL